MNLLLIRHGEKETDFGGVAIKLTDKGHRQADLVGKRLKDGLKDRGAAVCG